MSKHLFLNEAWWTLLWFLLKADLLNVLSSRDVLVSSLHVARVEEEGGLVTDVLHQSSPNLVMESSTYFVRQNMVLACVTWSAVACDLTAWASAWRQYFCTWPWRSSPGENLTLLRSSCAAIESLRIIISCRLSTFNPFHNVICRESYHIVCSNSRDPSILMFYWLAAADSFHFQRTEHCSG